MQSSRKVVILGGGPGGIALAHKLLRYIRPQMSGLSVTLVTPSTHFYWNIPATRAMIPGAIAETDLFQPIEPHFQQYPEGSFNLVLGKASQVNATQRTVEVTTVGGSQTVISYNKLVIATGSSTAFGDFPFKSDESFATVSEKFHAIQQQVALATHIVIAGGGPLGVEVAGELASHYGDMKKITLVSSEPTILPRLNAAAVSTAEKELSKLNVQIITGTRVLTPAVHPDNNSGIPLSNGQVLDADFVIPAGGVVPNTSFLPPEFLDERRHVRVEPTFQVPGHPEMWAMGDVLAVDEKQLVSVERHLNHLFLNLHAVLTRSNVKLVKYRPTGSPSIVISIGKKSGVGQVGSFRIWPFVATQLKSKSVYASKGRALVAGKSIGQSSI